MYSLIHLVHFVRLWGPLWTHSAFGFESANGILKRQVHGTRSILLQMVFMMRMRQSLAFNRKNGNDVSLQEIGQNSSIIGKISKRKLQPDNAKFLGQIYVHTFGIKLANTIYYSKEHSKVDAARNSCIISFLDAAGHLSFGCIVNFIITDQPQALIEKFTVLPSGILDDADSHELQNVSFEMTEVTKCLNNIIFKVKKLSIAKELIILLITSILSKCLLVPVKSQEWNFIVLLPNVLEITS